MLLKVWNVHISKTSVIWNYESVSEWHNTGLRDASASKNLPLKMGEKNLNKDFSNTRRGGGDTILRKFFSKTYIFLNDGFPKCQNVPTLLHAKNMKMHS